MLTALLIALCGDEERERFIKLYNALEGRVRGLIRHYVHDEFRAEETAQQCWAQVIGAFDRISCLPWAAAKGYVAVCARNAAMDQLRRMKHEAVELSMSEAWEPEAPGQEGDAFGRLVEIIRSMPENYREVLELKYVCEWTNKQIAQSLNLTETAVSTRVSRGRALLIERLQKEGYEYE